MFLSNVEDSQPTRTELYNDALVTDKNRWAAERSNTIIEELGSRLSHEAQVLTPITPGYKESIVRWSDAVEKKAGIVAYVKSPEDVRECIAYARQQSIDFVVTGGKHSTSGASSTDNGMVIDLGKMREVTVYPETRTVRVQGGCIWKDVDEAAGKYGLAMVGGTVNHTGVGGLTLGGGYGWLSGRHGLTADCLLEATMVLADGSIKKVSKTENPDLFWAIRGAGHSFGVVTEFLFQGVEQKNQIWAGQIVFNPEETLERVVQFANNLKTRNDPDVGMAMALGPPPFLPRPGIFTTLFCNGPQEKGEEVFAELLAIPSIKKNVGMRNYDTMNSMLNFATEYGGRKASKGASAIYPLSPIFVSNILAQIELFHKSVPDSKKTMVNIECFCSDAWCAVPRDATSFFNRGHYQNVVINPNWQDEAFDETGRAWARHINALFRTEIDWRRQAFNDPAASQDIREYGNYDGIGASSQTIFGTNYPRLAALKAHYDPSDIFNKDYAFTSASRTATASSHSSSQSSPQSSAPGSGTSTAASTAPSSPKSETTKPVLEEKAATGAEAAKAAGVPTKEKAEQRVKFKGYNAFATGAVEEGKQGGKGKGSNKGGPMGMRQANGSQALTVGFEDPAAVFVEEGLEGGDSAGGGLEGGYLGEAGGRKDSVVDTIG